LVHADEDKVLKQYNKFLKEKLWTPESLNGWKAEIEAGRPKPPPSEVEAIVEAIRNLEMREVRRIVDKCMEVINNADEHLSKFQGLRCKDCQKSLVWLKKGRPPTLCGECKRKHRNRTMQNWRNKNLLKNQTYQKLYYLNNRKRRLKALKGLTSTAFHTASGGFQ
jgi:hypothetical protein